MKRANIIGVIIILILIGCQSNNSQELSEQEISKIKSEINNRVDSYFEAVKVLNLEEMFEFWSDSEDFIFAGDGRILGGYKEWTNEMNQFAEITDHFLYWNNKNIKIEALSRNAASYTMEFDNERIGVSGDTLNTKGSWTYVFKKNEGKWRVIQTNGTHIEY